jgi:hypothetical protein
LVESSEEIDDCLVLPSRSYGLGVDESSQCCLSREQGPQFFGVANSSAVMNTRDEIATAFDHYESGRVGRLNALR